MKKIDAILVGDFHLREDTPIARTDNYEAAQWGKLYYISELQKKYDCPVIHSGDLFHHWKPSPSLLTKVIKKLPKQFYTVYGNHDLPQHNLELANKCGVDTLWAAGKLNILSGSWGRTVKQIETFEGASSFIFRDTPIKKNILVWHVMTWKNELPYPGCTDSNAKKLLKKYPQYNLIHTGHNHKTFVEKHKGRLLVNVGGLMRTNADQIDHKPCVFLYHAESNTVTKEYLPIQQGVVSRKHIETKQKRDNRIGAFIMGLNKGNKITYSFEKNMEIFLHTNKIKKEVVNIINKVV